MTEPLGTQIDEDALKYILSLPNGRKVLWDILGLTGLYRQPRVAGDTEGTAFNCGGLNVGLAIYADCLTVAPDLTAMMTKEQASYDNRGTSPESSGSDPDSGLPAGLTINRQTGGLEPEPDGSGNR